ncbi:MAG TPA: PA0069 family radical SAM protein [Pirellulaceae bacterium]|nr:PA0069 family radical SAM protein [Pirellulaceae bacterium]
MSHDARRLPKGRAAAVNPKNRFESLHAVDDFEQLDAHDEMWTEPRRVATEFLPDRALTLLRENNSPDIPFRYSLNAYRGCEHGCAYCYARPSHETLGMNAGLDFESKILVKHDAPQLLRRELNHPRWPVEWIAMSGVTDCYQPAERTFRLTRQLLEVLLEARQPFEIITKNALVARDLDLLQPLAEMNLVRVNISLTSLDAELLRTLEPRTSSPQARLRAIAELSAAGVPARVMVAPIIPGLNDHEIGTILTAAKAAGAVGAGFVLLRLPWSVSPIFLEWLAVHRPLAKEKVEALVRDTREGKINDPKFKSRMRGTGSYAQNITRTFELFATKLGLRQPLPPLERSLFRPPRDTQGQGMLF